MPTYTIIYLTESNQAVLEEYKNKLMDRIRSQGEIGIYIC